MIQTKADQLVEQLARLKNLRENLDELRAFDTRLQQIKDLVIRLQPLVDTNDVFMIKGIGNVDLGLLGDELRVIVRETQDVVRERPSLLRSPGSISALEGKAKRFSRELEAGLSEVWRNYMIRTLPLMDEDLLQLLGRINVFNDAVATIRQIAFKIKQFEGSPPRTVRRFEQFEQLVEELKLAWSELGGGPVPPAVRDFLKAVITTGASLDLLTAEVREWLDKHKIASSFRIKL